MLNIFSKFRSVWSSLVYGKVEKITLVDLNEIEKEKNQKKMEELRSICQINSKINLIEMAEIAGITHLLTKDEVYKYAPSYFIAPKTVQDAWLTARNSSIYLRYLKYNYCETFQEFAAIAVDDQHCSMDVQQQYKWFLFATTIEDMMTVIMYRPERLLAYSSVVNRLNNEVRRHFDNASKKEMRQIMSELGRYFDRWSYKKLLGVYYEARKRYFQICIEEAKNSTDDCVFSLYSQIRHACDQGNDRFYQSERSAAFNMVRDRVRPENLEEIHALLNADGYGQVYFNALGYIPTMEQKIEWASKPGPFNAWAKKELAR